MYTRTASADERESAPRAVSDARAYQRNDERTNERTNERTRDDRPPRETRFSPLPSLLVGRLARVPGSLLVRLGDARPLQLREHGGDVADPERLGRDDA